MSRRGFVKGVIATVLAGFLNLVVVVSAHGMLMVPQDHTADSAITHSECVPEAAEHSQMEPVSHDCPDASCGETCSLCVHGVVLLSGAVDMPGQSVGTVPGAVSFERWASRGPDPSDRPPQSL